MRPETLTLISGGVLIAIILFAAWRMRRRDGSRLAKKTRKNDPQP